MIDPRTQIKESGVPVLKDVPKDDLSKLVTIMEQAAIAKNTMLVSEFMKYRPLFMKDGAKSLSTAKYIKLCMEYQQRVSLYHPVRVVQKTEKGYTVVLTLPPIFNQLESFNTIGRKAVDAVIYFHNASSREHTLSIDPDRATNIMSQCVQFLGHNDNMKQKMAQSEKIESNVNQKMGQPAKPEKAVSTEDWF